MDERYYIIEEVRDILGYKTNTQVVRRFVDLYYSEDSIVRYGRGEYLILKESVLAYQEQMIDRYLFLIAGGGYHNEFHRKYALVHRLNGLLKKHRISDTVMFRNISFTITLVREYNVVIDFTLEVKNRGNQNLTQAEAKLRKLLIEVLANNTSKKNVERLRKGLLHTDFKLNSFSDCLANIYSNFNGAINYLGETYTFDNLDSLRRLVQDVELKERIVRVYIYNEDWNLTKYKVKFPELFKIEDIKNSSLRKGLYYIKTCTNSGVEQYYEIEKE